MTWNPRYHHVTQIHSDGSGWNDCWAASFGRYLREKGAKGLPEDDLGLINAVDLVAHGGIPDNPSNPDTTLDESALTLNHYGIPVQWTTSYRYLLGAPWSILLVDGTLLSPSQYPASWFGDPGQGNHFILWLPQWQGVDNWFNDPLVPSNRDVQYALASVAEALYGGFMLPTTANGETGPVRKAVVAECALKVQANHTCLALASVPAKGQVIDLQKPSGEWSWVQWRDRYGYVLTKNLVAVS